MIINPDSSRQNKQSVFVRVREERVQRAFIDGMVDAQAFRREVLGGFETYYDRYQAEALPEGSDNPEGETIDIEAGNEAFVSEAMGQRLG